jgi:hypothetical protein
MSFRDWLNKGWLTTHKTSPSEISELFGIADRDLKDCRTEGLSTDWRLNIAYNAALQLATAALAACGYRAGREAHHYRVIQSLVAAVEKLWDKHACSNRQLEQEREETLRGLDGFLEALG